MAQITLSSQWTPRDVASRVANVLLSGPYGGRGEASTLVERKIGLRVGLRSSQLTTSASVGLLGSLLALGVKPGDKVVIPGFGYVAALQAVLVAGAVPLIVDVERDTLSMSPTEVANLDDPTITGLIIIHYAGTPANMRPLRQIAEDRKWWIVEDAAHAFGAVHEEGPTGTLGDIGVFSFGSQKNLQVGEGGAVVSRHEHLLDQLRTVLALGVSWSNRRGQLSGSFDVVTAGIKGYPPDYVATLLDAQLEAYNEIQRARNVTWFAYQEQLASWSEQFSLGLPSIPTFALSSSQHIFWCLFPDSHQANSFIHHMEGARIDVRKHYTSLGATTLGGAYRTGQTPVSDHAGESLVRLPLGMHVRMPETNRVIERALEWKP